MKFDTDIEKVWLYKINGETIQIEKEIYVKLHKFIKSPLISLNDSKGLWGQWTPSNRTINLSLNLLRNYEWGAVKHVLRHEYAHLIVDEVFGMNLSGVSHGEAFKKACDALGIDADRCASHAYLSSYKTSETNEVVDKVRKLMNKGNCSSLNKEEADLFLNKAREIMIRHNIDMNKVCGSERFWVVRPIGPLYKKVPYYISTLRDIIKTFYFVRTIETYAYVNIDGLRQRRFVIEIFGEKNNVELAEYIYHALLTNAELLWKEFSSDLKNKHEPIRGRYHKNNFIEGLFNGYHNQLSENEKKVVDQNTEALIHINDPLLEELFKKQYPNIKYSSYYTIRNCGGYNNGLSIGKQMRIHQGVGDGSASKGNLLKG